VSHSVLDIFILSLLDRGLETPYDLQRQGGLSLGSTVPALRRLETSGFIKKKTSGDRSSKRPRHCYQLKKTGLALAQNGWKIHIKAPDQHDLESILRVFDMAQHYRAKNSDIIEFLKAVALQRMTPANLRLASSSIPHLEKEHMDRVKAWSAAKRKAEIRFLSELSRSFRRLPHNLRRDGSQRPPQPEKR
jgi:DNA-binding PadR family transcriptional regulator